MTLPVTLALLAAALALAVFAGWRGARPSQPHLGVRMAPWRFIMVTAGAAIFLLVIHLAALLGLPQAPPR
jgi:Mn2+/Fe2+ NRAMP family transporter